jgi:hypothetical protein
VIPVRKDLRVIPEVREQRDLKDLKDRKDHKVKQEIPVVLDHKDQREIQVQPEE